MILNMKLIQKESEPVLAGFRQLEQRVWDKSGLFLELETEIGSLGRALTIWENYRHGRKSRHQLADELSDILFVLIRIAKDYQLPIDSSIRSWQNDAPEELFFRLCNGATRLRLKIELQDNEAIASCRRAIREMLRVIAGLAEHYQLPLEQAHRAEMELALAWQRNFQKNQNLGWLREINWLRQVKQHERQVEAMVVV